MTTTPESTEKEGVGLAACAYRAWMHAGAECVRPGGRSGVDVIADALRDYAAIQNATLVARVAELERWQEKLSASDRKALLDDDHCEKLTAQLTAAQAEVDTLRSRCAQLDKIAGTEVKDGQVNPRGAANMAVVFLGLPQSARQPLSDLLALVCLEATRVAQQTVDALTAERDAALQRAEAAEEKAEGSHAALCDVSQERDALREALEACIGYVPGSGASASAHRKARAALAGRKAE